jgi:1,2-dihydroxy-3-keto-5-methylthiopentene dioxygenase
MAILSIPDEHRKLTDTRAICDFLKPFGIWYERWDAEHGVGPDATADEILNGYAVEIETLKAKCGYVTADVIDVTPETPGLETMLNRFNKEHTHAEDEVRFIVNGSGIFHIHPTQPAGAPVFAIELQAGDMINVPAGTRHWFDLCAARTIRAIRLFRDKSGWTPEYEKNGVHENYQPICFGPRH